MLKIKSKILISFLAAISISANAANPTFCQAYKDDITAQAYIVPDGIKPYSALKKEIDNFERVKAEELKKVPVDTIYIAELNTIIAEKTAKLNLKINYQEQISTLKSEIKKISSDKSKLHREVIKLIAKGRTTEANGLCGGLVISPFSCTAENNYSSQITNKKASLSSVKDTYNRERKWAARTISTKEGQNVFSLGKAQQVATSMYSVSTDPSSIALNGDGDGISGSVTSYSTQLYTCADDKLTLSPNKRGTITNLPMFIKKDGSSQIKIFFCATSFLGEGDCLSYEELINPNGDVANSGWETAVIFKNQNTEVKTHGDHIQFKSQCSNIGTPTESCVLSVKMISMGDVDKDNLSLKTTEVLASNDSYNKVVQTAISGEYQKSFNSAKQEFHNPDGCTYKTIAAASGDVQDESQLITCDGYQLDENGRPIKTLDATGAELYARKEVNHNINLLTCPVVEKCLVEKQETINYTEGCVSPFPLDEVIIKTDVPEGNCALKFDKEAYICDAKRVMNSRSCEITRNQEIETCTAKLTTQYNITPVPAIIEDVNGVQVKRMMINTDIDEKPEMAPSGNGKVEINVAGAHKGANYLSINQIFRKQDMGKYVVFKIMTYHNYGDHAQSGLTGTQFRPWGYQQCGKVVPESGYPCDDSDDTVDFGCGLTEAHVEGGQSSGSSKHCGNINWFVINLQNDNGGDISPRTWTPPGGFGNVYEVSRTRSRNITFGPYMHATNSSRQWGGSPDEDQFDGIIGVVAPNPGDPWCSEVEESRLISENEDTWEIKAPYAKCSVKFTRLDIDPPKTCSPAGFPWSQYNKKCIFNSATPVYKENNEVLNGGSEQVIFTSFSSIPERRNPSISNSTGMGLEVIKDCKKKVGNYCYYDYGPVTYCEYDDDDVASCKSKDKYRKLLRYKENVPYIETTYKIQTTGQQAFGAIVVHQSFKDTYDQAVIDSNNCKTTLANWITNKTTYDNCMAGAPPHDACINPGAKPNENCELSDHGWDKPFVVKSKTGGVNGLASATISIYDDTDFFDAFADSSGAPIWNNFNDFIIPHISLTKAVGSEAKTCINMNNLR